MEILIIFVFRRTARRIASRFPLKILVNDNDVYLLQRPQIEVNEENRRNHFLEAYDYHIVK